MASQAAFILIRFLTTCLTVSLLLVHFLCGVESGERQVTLFSKSEVALSIPDDWSFSSLRSTVGESVLLSKEDPVAGPYQTGIRFSLFENVSSHFNRVPSEWCSNRFLDLRDRIPTLQRSLFKSSAERFNGMAVRYEMEYAEKFSSNLYQYRCIWLWSDALDLTIVIEARTPGDPNPEFEDLIKQVLKTDFSSLIEQFTIPTYETRTAAF